jgi:coenzyme F420-dependent glucose-6-phosphate dehydrogenase
LARLSAGNRVGVVALGYALSSEELGPQQLVDNAVAAERAGFGYALVSDHYHPWLDVQGESPFVWSTIGALSQATRSLAVGTGVTCPLIRLHPAIVAQAAATSAALMPGRFFLGLARARTSTSTSSATAGRATRNDSRCSRRL